MAISLSQAIDGFVLECGARRLSEHTTSSYVSALGKFTTWLGTDPALASIGPETPRRFLAETRGPHSNTKSSIA
jgi:site-specific recombinase XerD